MKRSVLLTLFLSAVVATATAVPAQAAGFTTLVPTDQANGRVWSTTYMNGIEYLAGEFTAVTDHNQVSVPRQNLAAIDLATGSVTSWDPGADGPVYSIVNDGTNVFVGGNFHTAGGLAAGRLAAIDASGQRVAGWNGTAGYIVRNLIVRGTKLYVCGDFDKLDSVSRPRVGALSTVDGSLLPLTATIDKAVRSMALSPNGKILYLGGYFTSINGKAMYHEGAIKTKTGATLPFAWHTSGSAYPEDMQADANGVYYGIAGKGTDLHGIASTTLKGGKSRWVKHTCGDTQGIEVVGNTMYIGGHLRCILSLSAWPVEGLGAVNASTGDPVAWGDSANIGCQKGCLGVWDLTTCSTYLCISGDFSKVNNDEQAKFGVLE
jgi:hypothetical protein